MERISAFQRFSGINGPPDSRCAECEGPSQFLKRAAGLTVHFASGRHEVGQKFVPSCHWLALRALAPAPGSFLDELLEPDVPEPDDGAVTKEADVTGLAAESRVFATIIRAEVSRAGDVRV